MYTNTQTFFERKNPIIKILVCSSIRQKLIERGTNIIATLPRVFKTMPSFDGKDKVSVNDFFHGLSQFGYNLRKEDAVLLVRYFDRDNSEMMNFDDFLLGIRGKPNDERQAVIDLVFYKFDKNKTGTAEATELRKVFNCVNHPRFLLREYTEDQIFYLYLQNFSNKINGTVSKKVKFYIKFDIIKEWDDYYAGVSCTIDNDSHFIKLIKNQFKVE